MISRIGLLRQFFEELEDDFYIEFKYVPEWGKFVFSLTKTQVFVKDIPDVFLVWDEHGLFTLSKNVADMAVSVGIRVDYVSYLTELLTPRRPNCYMLRGFADDI